MNSVTLRRLDGNMLALTAGLGAGAGLMYLCDPHRGGARRKRLMARTAGLLHRDERKLEKRAKHVLNRVQGFAEAVSSLAPEEHVSDKVLVDRVRSRIGNVLPNPKRIQIHAQGGVVTLEGKLTNAEKRKLREEVSAIPGVTRVNDRLKSRSVFAPGLLLGIAAGLAIFNSGSSLNPPHRPGTSG